MPSQKVVLTHVGLGTDAWRSASTSRSVGTRHVAEDARHVGVMLPPGVSRCMLTCAKQRVGYRIGPHVVLSDCPGAPTYSCAFLSVKTVYGGVVVE